MKDLKEDFIELQYLLQKTIEDLVLLEYLFAGVIILNIIALILFCLISKKPR